MQVGRVNIRCGTILHILCVSVSRIGTVGVCNLCGNVAEQLGGELIKQDGIQLAGLQTGIVPDLSLLFRSKPTGILQNQLLNNIIYHIALIAVGHTNQVADGLVNIQEAVYDTKAKIAAQQLLYDIAVGAFRTRVGRNVPNQLHNTAYNIGRGSFAAGHSVNCAQIYIAGSAGQQKQCGLAVQERIQILNSFKHLIHAAQFDGDATKNAQVDIHRCDVCLGKSQIHKVQKGCAGLLIIEDGPTQ